MTNRIVSEYVVRMKDDVSRGSKSAGTALKNLTREAQALNKIGSFRSASRSLALLGTQYKSAQYEVKRLALAMTQSGTATGKLKSDFDKAARSLQRAKSAFQNQQSVVQANSNALRYAGVNVKNLTSEENRLRASIERTNAAMRKQEAAARRRAGRREALGTMGAMAGMYAGHKVKSTFNEMVDVGRDFDKERRFTKAIMSETDEGMRPFVNQAIHLAGQSRYNDIQVMEGQRTLAARGVKKDSILGMIPEIANYGAAMDLSLPDSAKQIERSLFTFQRDVSTKEKAEAATRKTADLQVKASKISGMTPDDLSHLYNFGAPSAKAAGMKEESLLALGATLKKAGIGGDQAGVAYRAMIASLTRMTRIGQTSMLANGLNYSDYQRVPDKLELAPFVTDVAKTYGIKLNEEAQARLAKVFSDKDMVRDPAKFTPAVKEIMEDELGKQDAKSAKAIATSANRYRDSSGKSVDIDRLIYDIMMKAADNPNMLNSIFGSKQGGRLAAALGNPEEFKKMFQEIYEGSEGYSKKIADERNQGFAFAVDRMGNTWKNALTNIYRAWDNGGESKGGFLTAAATKAGDLAQHFAELDSKTVAVVSGFAGITGLVAGAHGTMKLFGMLSGSTSSAALTGSATALTASAAALDSAAIALGGKGAIAGTAANAAGAAGTAGKVSRLGRAAGVLGRAVPLVAAGAIAYEMSPKTDDDFRSVIERNKKLRLGGASFADTTDVNLNRLGGNSDWDFITGRSVTPEIRKLQDEVDRLKLASDLGGGTAITQAYEAKKAELEEKTRAPEAFRKASSAATMSTSVDGSGMDDAKLKAATTEEALRTALSVTGKPVVDTSSLDQAQAKADKLRSTLSSINGMSSGIGSSVRNIHADTGFGTP